MPVSSLQAGHSIRGYRVLAPLGEGTMGTVYRAHQPAVDRQVAIKAVRPEFVEIPAFIARFGEEARLIARLEHAYIVPLYDFWVGDEGAFLVMRLMRGGSLADALKKGSLDLAPSLQILGQICSALDVVHSAGVVHQDLKPANIMLDEYGDAYLADFGIAADIRRRKDGDEGFAGTPNYAAPEQFQGLKISPQTDLYALSLIAFEMFCGRSPYSGMGFNEVLIQKLTTPLPNIKEFNADLPGELGNILQRGAAIDSAQRFPNAAAFIQAMRDMVNVSAKTPELVVSSSTVHFPASLEQKVSVQLPDFIGREQDLQRLDHFLVRALESQGGIVFVSGSAGRGKTSLVQHFIRRAETYAPNLLVGPGFCNAFSGAGDPYLPFRDVLASLSGEVEPLLASGLLSIRQARQIWSVIPSVLEALYYNGIDLLDRLLSARSLQSRAASALPDLVNQLAWITEARPSRDIGQPAIFEQVARLLTEVSEIHPILIWLDDLHWIDETSAGLLFHLVRRIQNHPVLIIGTFRLDEITQPLAGEAHSMQPVLAEVKRVFGDIVIDLGSSDEQNGRAFVDALLDSRPNLLTEDFRSALHHHTGGHPLFTLELLRSLQDSGQLVLNEQDCLIQPGSIDWQELPPRVEAIIEARIERLDDDLAEILSVASVMGDEFIAQVIAQVHEYEELRLLRRLSREIDRRHQLIKESAQSSAGSRFINYFRFAHVLFQQYLYASLSMGERRLLHGEIAAAFEKLFIEDVQQVTVQLAYHFSRAGLKKKAIEYLLLSGKRARTNFALEQAVAYFSEAFELADDPDIQREAAELRASVYIDLYQGQPAINDYQFLLNDSLLLGEPTAEFEALLGLARAYNILAYNTNELSAAERSLDLYQRAALLAQTIGDQTALVRTKIHMVWLCDFFGSIQRQMPQIVGEALEISRELEDQRLVLQCQVITGWAYNFDGDLNVSLSLCEDAIQKLTAAGNLVLVRDAYFYIMISNDWAGRFEHSIACANRAIEIAGRLGVDPVQYHSFKANPLSAMGRFTQSWESLYQEMYSDTSRISEVTRLEAMAHWYDGCLQHENAIEAAFDAYKKSVALNRVWVINIVLPIWIQNLIWAGKFHSDHLAFFEREVERVGLSPSPMPMIEASILGGEYTKAISIATKAMRKEQARGALKFYLNYLEQKGRALVAAGEYSGAEELVSEGIELAGKINYMALLWRLWDVRARARQGYGDERGAEEAFQAAKALLQYLAINLPDDNSRSMFFRSPLLVGYEF